MSYNVLRRPWAPYPSPAARDIAALTRLSTEQTLKAPIVYRSLTRPQRVNTDALFEALEAPVSAPPPPPDIVYVDRPHLPVIPTIRDHGDTRVRAPITDAATASPPTLTHDDVMRSIEELRSKLGARHDRIRPTENVGHSPTGPQRGRQSDRTTAPP